VGPSFLSSQVDKICIGDGYIQQVIYKKNLEVHDLYDNGNIK